MAVAPPNAGQQAEPKQAEQADTGRKDAGPGSLAGNLTRDPELRYTPNGRPVCSMRVAVTDRKQDAKSGEWKDGPTTFYDVAAWGQLAENCAEHLARGHRIVVEGRWESQSWTDKDEQVQERIVLVARDLGPSMLFAGAQVVVKGRGR